MGQAKLKEPEYSFTNNWLNQTADAAVWSDVIRMIAPQRILEVGCYEGRATTFLMDNCVGPLSVTCIDTWEGGNDLTAEMMKGVEQRFDANTKIAIGHSEMPITFQKIKQRSASALPRLLADGRRFDLIYVDASHTAPDVLSDAVDCFRLLREGGAMILDDYVWYEGEHGKQNLLEMPKPAIDAFVNLYFRKLRIVYIRDQLIFQKTHD